jgi:hypothetical protein
MKIQDFIDQNREEITSAINRVLCHVPATASCYCPLSGTDHNHTSQPLDDDDLEKWILNDEGLYNWAVSEGVEDI